MVVLICIYLRTNDIFSCVSYPFVYILYQVTFTKIFKIFCPIFICFYSYWVVSILLYHGYKTFIRYIICKYFLPIYGLSFHFLIDVFWSAKGFNFAEAQFVIFFLFMDCAFGIVSRNALPKVTKILSYILQGSCFNSYINIYDLLWVTFCIYGEVRVHILFLANGYPIVLALFVEKTLFSLNCLGFYVKNQLTINARIYFWTPTSVPLVCRPISVPILHTLS